MKSTLLLSIKSVTILIFIIGITTGHSDDNNVALKAEIERQEIILDALKSKLKMLESQTSQPEKYKTPIKISVQDGAYFIDGSAISPDRLLEVLIEKSNGDSYWPIIISASRSTQFDSIREILRICGEGQFSSVAIMNPEKPNDG